MVRKAKKTTPIETQQSKKEAKKTVACLKDTKQKSLNLDETALARIQPNSSKKRKCSSDISSKALAAVKHKVPKEAIARVLTMVVGGRKLTDYVEEELELKGPNTRLSTLFWSPHLRSFKVYANPLAGQEPPKGKVEWPVAFIDALTDCHSQNACARGHGVLAMKACLDETPVLSDTAVFGLFNTVFELQCSCSTFKDKMLALLLAWISR